MTSESAAATRTAEARPGAADAPMAAMLRALGHPVRLGIMRALADRPETCACDFTDLFSVSQPTISQHLKVLREAGLVVSRRQGTQICYSVHPEGIDSLVELLTALRPLGSSPAN